MCLARASALHSVRLEFHAERLHSFGFLWGGKVTLEGTRDPIPLSRLYCSVLAGAASRRLGGFFASGPRTGPHVRAAYALLHACMSVQEERSGSQHV